MTPSRYFTAMLRGRMAPCAVPTTGITRHRLPAEPHAPEPPQAAAPQKKPTVQQERSLANQALIRTALKRGYSDAAEIAKQCALSFGQTHFGLRRMRLAGEVVRIPLAEHKGRYRFEMATPSNCQGKPTTDGGTPADGRP